MRVDGLIFDFDGVLLESEWAHNEHLADYLTGIGHPTSIEEAMRHFMGLSGADFLGALERWRETGAAPDQIIASRNPGRGGLTPMTRPLCPYPQVAKYKGTGSTDDASNFVCAAP